jgi:hypothetical protein
MWFLYCGIVFDHRIYQVVDHSLRIYSLCIRIELLQSQARRVTWKVTVPRMQLSLCSVILSVIFGFLS